MEEFDAFTSGVEPGGLRSRNEIKILICYLVSKLDFQITREQLTKIICEEGIANYFDLNQSLSEVIENGSIAAVGSDVNPSLAITPVGKNNIVTIENDIPYTVRETAFNAAVRLETRLRREQENIIEIEPIDGGGYNIRVSVVDGKDELMSLSLFAADYEQAQYVKEKFLADPVRVYSNIIAMLMA